MSGLLAIAGREFGAMFRTPTGWVVTALYLLLSGVWLAATGLRPGEPATLRPFFAASEWLLLVVAPAISMRLVSEELRTGTMEPMMAAPVSDWATIFGKLAGAVLFLAAMLTPTLSYVVVLEIIADPDPGPIAVGYLGLLLVGVLYLSVGLLFSSLTRSQVVAFLGTLFFFLLLWIGTSLGARIATPRFEPIIYGLSISARLGDFAKGVLDTSHVVFFIAASVWAAGLAVIPLEVRRWR